MDVLFYKDNILYFNLERLRNDDGLLTPCAVSLYEEGSKQIHLFNGKFEYVKPKNNFKDYGL